MIVTEKEIIMEYGNAPVNLGPHDLETGEMMFYLYLPVKMAGSMEFKVPERLFFINDILKTVNDDCVDNLPDYLDHYVYATVKTLWVEGGFSGNRPGWHADGYGSGGDLNYIWYDMNPTEFAIQDFHDISDNDFQSMIDMENQIDYDKIVVYPCNHLLKIDESVVHRVNPIINKGVRTFIKISVSKHKFNLKGNARNYLFDYDWNLHNRQELRNMDNKDHVKE